MMMIQQIVLVTILLIPIEFVAVWFVYEFVKSGNGPLRGLMIWFFSVEIWLYVMIFLLFMGYTTPIQYIMLVLIPKAFIKARMGFYLYNKRRQEKKQI